MFDINIINDWYAEQELNWEENPVEEWPDDLWDD